MPLFEVTISEAGVARAAILSIFGPLSAALLEAHEHFDGMMLVSAWFRKYPGELKKTLTPAQALERCAL